jgi:predicted SAM-dependent methyltransferase
MSFVSKKLNIGCGEFKKEGFVNLDIRDDVDADVVHDLNDLPYPFADNQFEYIEMDHVLEHAKDPFLTMKELHRIASDGASIIIRVPHFSRGFTHPDHKRGFDVTFPYYFNPAFKGGYQGYEYVTNRIMLTWFAQKYLKKLTVGSFLYYPSFFFGEVVSFLANLSPVFCSRLWCFWVGGFEEVAFFMKVKK